MGQLEKSMETNKLQAGIYRHVITADDLPAGTYYRKIKTEKLNITKKVVILQH